MLCVARQARTAYSNGPVQNRRCVAGQEIRGGWTNTLTGWFDPQWTNSAHNQTVISVGDSSFNSFASAVNWGPTTIVSTQWGLFTTSLNVKGLQFDGVDDITQSSANVLLNNAAALTIVALYRNNSASDAVIMEGGTDYNFQTGSMILSGSSTAATSSIRGNVGYSTRTWASNQTPWICTATVQDKSAGLGSEILVYENGTQVTVFTVSVNSDNTNTFGSQVCRIGRRAGGTMPMNGIVAAVLIFTRKLSLFEIQQATQLVRWRSGLT